MNHWEVIWRNERIVCWLFGIVCWFCLWIDCSFSVIVCLHSVTASLPVCLALPA